jgi:hypothetical protein
MVFVSTAANAGSEATELDTKVPGSGLVGAGVAILIEGSTVSGPTPYSDTAPDQKDFPFGTLIVGRPCSIASTSAVWS